MTPALPHIPSHIPESIFRDPRSSIHRNHSLILSLKLQRMESVTSRDELTAALIHGTELLACTDGCQGNIKILGLFKHLCHHEETSVQVKYL